VLANWEINNILKREHPQGYNSRHLKGKKSGKQRLLPIFIKATLGVYQHQFAIMKHGGCIPLMCDHYTNEVNGSAVLTIRWMPPSGTCPLVCVFESLFCVGICFSVEQRVFILLS